MATKISREATKEEVELQMTPMIDATFLLLIFFMLTMKFKKIEGKLQAYLPKDVGVNTTPLEEEPLEPIRIRIIVDKEEPFDDHSRPDGVGTRQFVHWSVGPTQFHDLAKLRDKVAELHKATPELRGTIEPMGNVHTQHVVDIMDICIAVGLTDITFQGTFEDVR